jgi:ribonuclease BN (tRNA processing enzyme)
MAPVDASLTLLPVGVGAAYARPGEVQSSYLVLAGGRAICLDLGSGALNRLQRHVAPEDLTALVITHLHPDHCADLFSLRVYMAFGPGVGRRLAVLGPPGLRERLAAFGGEEGWDEAFQFRPLADHSALELGGGVTLRCAEVPHSPPTYAVRIDANGASLCFSADCEPNRQLAELAAGCDLLLCECSFGDQPLPPGSAHLNAREAARVALTAGAGRLLLTHCYPEHDRERTLAQAREVYRGPVAWAVQDEAVSA